LSHFDRKKLPLFAIFQFVFLDYNFHLSLDFNFFIFSFSIEKNQEENSKECADYKKPFQPGRIFILNASATIAPYPTAPPLSTGGA
jgi:hypothetical protein